MSEVPLYSNAKDCEETLQPKLYTPEALESNAEDGKAFLNPQL